MFDENDIGGFHIAMPAAAFSIRNLECFRECPPEVKHIVFVYLVNGGQASGHHRYRLPVCADVVWSLWRLHLEPRQKVVLTQLQYNAMYLICESALSLDLVFVGRNVSNESFCWPKNVIYSAFIVELAQTIIRVLLQSKFKHLLPEDKSVIFYTCSCLVQSGA